jgi:hypothetical protein
MRYLLLTLVLSVSAGTAFGQQICQNGRCYVQPRTHAYTTYVPSQGSTSTAQGVAERMAADGACRHYGNPTGGYEGVGMGSTPEAALGNCCYSRSGMRVVDQGVACGRNGRWYACRRYR